MSSLIEGYNYDIFISYRQKDNKGDHWVSEFVEALKTELESTFKEEISVYFDINPHDGLLETHDVDASLKEKLKCLIFIPIISRTYCDQKSFAWEHEFKAFVELATKDQFGLKVKLPNGNVASRVLPVRIHDLDPEDIKECASVLGAALRGIEFIYREPGVNKPLPKSDSKYSILINKSANSIKEIIRGLRNETEDRSKAEHQSDIKYTQNNEKSIIVLPFENMSSDPEQEYFSDGLTEEIITDLSCVHDLLVISRSSAMSFKGSNKAIPEIAREVHVRYVLEGSVRKSGNNLRIIAQLIDAITDTHIWAEKYNGIIDDVFEIQEKVSRSIADSLKVKLTSNEEQLISTRTIGNVLAYEYYLQARKEMYRLTMEAIERSLGLLRNAIDIAGENELLYATAGTAYCMAYRIKPDLQYLSKIEESVSIMLRLNPDSPSGHYLLGVIHDIRLEMQSAAKEYAKCLLTDGSNTDCMLQLSRIYCAAGRMEEAGSLLEKILSLDPLNLALVYSMPGYLKLLTGRFEDAVALYRKMYEIDPVSPIYLLMYSWALIYSGRDEEALKIIDQLAKDNPQSPFAALGLVYKYALTGDNEKLRNLVTPELEAAAGAAEYTSREMSNAYAIIGEKDKALEWLERSIDCGFINYPFIAKYNPFMKGLYSEPRFINLIEKVKNMWKTFEI